jgi:hypothetical protein
MKKYTFIAILFMAALVVSVAATSCASKRKYGCPGAIH